MVGTIIGAIHNLWLVAVDDQPPFVVRPGDTIYIPIAIFRSTINKGWEPLRLLALYNPAGAERALLDLPDYRSTPAGKILALRRSVGRRRVGKTRKANGLFPRAP